jgi:hypothetical protein
MLCAEFSPSSGPGLGMLKRRLGLEPVSLTWYTTCTGNFRAALPLYDPDKLISTKMLYLQEIYGKEKVGGKDVELSTKSQTGYSADHSVYPELRPSVRVQFVHSIFK